MTHPFFLGFKKINVSFFFETLGDIELASLPNDVQKEFLELLTALPTGSVRSAGGRFRSVGEAGEKPTVIFAFTKLQVAGDPLSCKSFFYSARLRLLVVLHFLVVEPRVQLSRCESKITNKHSDDGNLLNFWSA